ncbi:hypothetical protein PCE1_002187 [Barthelona sp. PCE]
MPRPVTKVSEFFSLVPFGDDTLISATSDEVHQPSYSIVDKSMNGVIDGPPVTASESDDESHLILRPTELEKTIFYQTSSLDDKMFKIEMFEYVDGQFSPLKNHEFFKMPGWKEGSMINQRFWVQVVDSTNVNFYDMDNNRTKVFEACMPFNSWMRAPFFVTQDEITYFIHWNSRTVMEKLAFNEEGIPYLISDGPLEGSWFYGFNATPGNNSIIFESREGMLVTCAETEDSYEKHPLDFVMPDFGGEYEYKHNEEWECKELAIINGIPVQKPNQPVKAGDAICHVWNFVLLDGIVYCSEYNSEAQCTKFYRVYTESLNGCCVLQPESTLHFTEYDPCFTEGLCEFPFAFDFYNNSVTLFAKTKENAELYNSYQYYDIERQEWRTCVVTKVGENNVLYLDGVEVFRYVRQEDEVEDCVTSFNDRHHAVYYNIDYYTYPFIINGHKVLETHDDIHQFKVCGDLVWLFDSMGMMNLFAMDQNGSVKKTVKKSLDCYSCKDMVTNDYCYEEVCFNQLFEDYENGNDMGYSFDCSYVQYDTESCSVKVVARFEVYNKSVASCFVDKGVLIFGSKMFIIDSSGVISSLDMSGCFDESFEDYILVSPKKGVAVWYSKTMKNHQVFMRIITFSDDYSKFEVEEKTVDMREFITQCSVSVFDSFNSVFSR